MELSSLNVTIVHIPGTRNKVADALSRTIFPDPDCRSDGLIDSLGEMDTSGGNPQWIWKDGIGGYEELLRLRETERFQGVLDGSSPVFPANEVIVANSLQLLSYNIEFGPVASKYADDTWYGDIYCYVTTNEIPDSLVRLERAAFIRHAKNFSMLEGELFYTIRGVIKKCVLKKRSFKHSDLRTRSRRTLRS